MPPAADNVSGPGLQDGRGANGYFERVTAVADWTEVDFGFTSMYQHILNESLVVVDISWDEGGSLSSAGLKAKQGELAASEGLTFDRRPARKVFVKGTGAIRITAW